MVKANLVIDLGNSETRCTLRVGEIAKNTRREHNFKLSNRFSALLGKLPTSEEYTPDNTTVLTVEPTEVGKGMLKKGTYVNGLMSDRELEQFQMRPTALVAKYDTPNTVLTTFTAIMKSAQWMQTYFANEGKEFSLEYLYDNTEWEVTILLPPSQTERGAEELENTLVGTHHVEYTIPNCRANIKITSINVFAEGVMAYFATLIKKSNKQLRASKRYLTTQTVLVVDIGAGTTDMVLIKNNAPIETSKHTIQYGGNNIKNRLKQQISQKYDLNLPNSHYDEASVHGKIKRGTKEYDIRPELDIAKQEVANFINRDIQDTLESADVSIQTVESILVVGGGSITSSEEGIHPISKFILEGLQMFSDSMELVNIEDVTDQSSLDLTGESTASDLVPVRELNLVGACISLDLKEMKESKQ